MIDFDMYFDRPAVIWPEPRRLDELISILWPEALGVQRQVLSGGYQNFNYRLQSEDNCAVLRIGRDPLRLGRELALLRRLAGSLPLPEVLAETNGAALLSFCPGVLVSTLPPDSPDLHGLGEAIGQTLAQVHQFECAKAGFFDLQLQISQPLEPFATAWLNYTRKVLQSPQARSRAGADLCEALLIKLDQAAGMLSDLPAISRLVHSDFNLKNLLVARLSGQWQVTALLDWEFAHAGSPLCDLGNFFRFQDQLPEDLLNGFLVGYQALAGPLPSQWRTQAILLDLAALAGFLESVEPRPLSWATARERMQDSLVYLSEVRHNAV